MTNENTTLSQEEINERMEALRNKELELLKDPGFLITVVGGLGSYTVGLSRDPKTPYEIVIIESSHFARDINPVVDAVRNGQFKMEHGAVFTSKDFALKVSGVIVNARYQMVEITSGSALKRLGLNLGLGWKTYGLVKDLKKVFAMVSVNKKNQLPMNDPKWEEKFYGKLVSLFPKVKLNPGLMDMDVNSSYATPTFDPNTPKQPKFWFSPYGFLPPAVSKVLNHRHEVLFSLVKKFSKINEPLAREFYEEKDYDKQVEIEKKAAAKLLHPAVVYHMRVKAAKKRKKNQRSK